jgi:hypothetical protein
MKKALGGHMAVDSEPPPDSSTELEKLKRLKDRDFPPGTPARAKFDCLCAAGCDARLLHSFLTVAVFSAGCKGTIYDLFGFSKSELVKLPVELERISCRLESVNRILTEYLRAKFIENPSWPDEVQSRASRQVAVYQGTPDLLRLLARHLRWASEWVNVNVGPKRYDTFRHSVLDLLSYVDTSTKNPHYEAVADLLSHLSSAQEESFQRLARSLPGPRRNGAKKSEIPPPSKLLISSDALKALYSRSAKYGFRKRRRSDPSG